MTAQHARSGLAYDMRKDVSFRNATEIEFSHVIHPIAQLFRTIPPEIECRDHLFIARSNLAYPPIRFMLLCALISIFRVIKIFYTGSPLPKAESGGCGPSALFRDPNFALAIFASRWPVCVPMRFAVYAHAVRSYARPSTATCASTSRTWGAVRCDTETRRRAEVYSRGDHDHGGGRHEPCSPCGERCLSQSVATRSMLSPSTICSAEVPRSASNIRPSIHTRAEG